MLCRNNWLECGNSLHPLSLLYLWFSSFFTSEVYLNGFFVGCCCCLSLFVVVVVVIIQCCCCCCCYCCCCCCCMNFVWKDCTKSWILFCLFTQPFRNALRVDCHWRHPARLTSTIEMATHLSLTVRGSYKLRPEKQCRLLSITSISIRLQAVHLTSCHSSMAARYQALALNSTNPTGGAAIDSVETTQTL